MFSIIYEPRPLIDMWTTLFVTQALPVLISGLTSCPCSLATCTPLAMPLTHGDSFLRHAGGKLSLILQFNSKITPSGTRLSESSPPPRQED